MVVVCLAFAAFLLAILALVFWGTTGGGEGRPGGSEGLGGCRMLSSEGLSISTTFEVSVVTSSTMTGSVWCGVGFHAAFSRVLILATRFLLTILRLLNSVSRLLKGAQISQVKQGGPAIWT